MHGCSIGTIRNATLLDAAELARLFESSGQPRRVDASVVLGWQDHGYLLVLDRCDGTLGAVAHVEVDRDHHHGIVDLLVVDPARTPGEIERRMNSVAHALCEAYGCDHVDIT